MEMEGFSSEQEVSVQNSQEATLDSQDRLAVYQSESSPRGDSFENQKNDKETMTVHHLQDRSCLNKNKHVNRNKNKNLILPAYTTWTKEEEKRLSNIIEQALDSRELSFLGRRAFWQPYNSEFPGRTIGGIAMRARKILNSRQF